MAEPTRVKVYGTYRTADGRPASGRVSLELDTRTVFTPDPSVIVPSGKSATLDANGYFEITGLAATDDPDLDPTGLTYTVRESINGQRRTYAIELPEASALAGVDLVTAAPAVAVTAVSTYAKKSELDAEETARTDADAALDVRLDAVEANGWVTTARLGAGAVTAAKVAADVATQAELDAHEAAADPHPGYLTPAEGDAAYSAAGHEHSALVTVEDNATTAYTVVAADAGKVKRFTHTDAVTVTLPTGLAVGTLINVLSWGAGGVTIAAGTGATVQGAGTLAQYAEASALVVAADTWSVQGTS